MPKTTTGKNQSGMVDNLIINGKNIEVRVDILILKRRAADTITLKTFPISNLKLFV